MSLGEVERLERVERLLGTALHETDQIPVDMRGGRARLAPRLAEQQRSVRRRWIICVAAAVLAVVVTTSIAFAGLRHHENSLPARPASDLTFTSSGLPVGVIVGKVDRTDPKATSTIRMTVLPDGSGVWNAGTVGDSAGDSVLDYHVQFVRDGPSRAVMRFEEGMCVDVEALTLEFSVRGHSLVIKKASSTDCLVNRGLGSDLTGTTLRIERVSGT